MHRDLILNDEEKYVYLRCMTFIMNMKGEDINEKTTKRLLVEIQMRNIDIPEKALDAIKKTNKVQDIVKELKKIDNTRVKTYIIREMIFMAIVDHELNDEEISVIYKIGVDSGIKEEKISDLFMWAAKAIEWQVEGWKLINSDM